MYFFLEALEETLLANRLQILWPFNKCFTLITDLAQEFCHQCRMFDYSNIICFLLLCLMNIIR